MLLYMLLAVKEIIEQFINQIEQDQKFSENTKSAYRSDLNELIEYITQNNSLIKDIDLNWVKNYFKHLEDTNVEKNSLNRRASTFRLFLKFLYLNKLAPTNYSLIINNSSTHKKFLSDSDEQILLEIKNLIEGDKLPIEQKLILLMIGRLGISGTDLILIQTHQVDFENRQIKFSESDYISIEDNLFKILRDYLLNHRNIYPDSGKHLCLFFNDEGNPLTENDVYKLIKKISIENGFEGKLTTRNLKKIYDYKKDILSIQKEVLGVISSI